MEPEAESDVSNIEKDNQTSSKDKDKSLDSTAEENEVPELDTSSGGWIQKKSVSKKGKISWKERFLYISYESSQAYELVALFDPEEAETAFVYPLNGAVAVAMDSDECDKCCFSVSNPNDPNLPELILSCASASIRDVWINDITYFSQNNHEEGEGEEEKVDEDSNNLNSNSNDIDDDNEKVENTEEPEPTGDQMADVSVSPDVVGEVTNESGEEEVVNDKSEGDVEPQDKEKEKEMVATEPESESEPVPVRASDKSESESTSSTVSDAEIQSEHSVIADTDSDVHDNGNSEVEGEGSETHLHVDAGDNVDIDIDDDRHSVSSHSSVSSSSSCATTSASASPALSTLSSRERSSSTTSQASQTSQGAELELELKLETVEVAGEEVEEVEDKVDLVEVEAVMDDDVEVSAVEEVQQESVVEEEEEEEDDDDDDPLEGIDEAVKKLVIASTGTVEDLEAKFNAIGDTASISGSGSGTKRTERARSRSLSTILRYLKDAEGNEKEKENKSGLVETDKLDLSGLGLQGWPGNVLKRFALTLNELYLQNNPIKDLPLSLSSLGRLKILDLSFAELSGGLSQSIGDLKSIDVLSLCGNSITALPRSIGNLTTLRELYLSHNQIAHIPDEIGNLTGVEVMYIDNNHIDELPESIKALNRIDVLELGCNQLDEFPAIALEMHSLRVIGMSNNRISAVPSKITSSLPQIEELKLANNRLKALPSELAGIPTLKLLDTRGNTDLAGNLPMAFGQMEREGRVLVDVVPSLLETMSEAIENGIGMAKKRVGEYDININMNMSMENMNIDIDLDKFSESGHRAVEMSQIAAQNATKWIGETSEIVSQQIRKATK